jgi:hypothetical protein
MARVILNSLSREEVFALALDRLAEVPALMPEQLRQALWAEPPALRPEAADQWDEYVKKDALLSLPEVDIMASVRFWEQLFAYITKLINMLHRHGCEFARLFMDTFMKDGGSMSIVRGFQWHLQAWKHQYLQYDMDQEKPQPNRLYLARVIG